MLTNKRSDELLKMTIEFYRELRLFHIAIMTMLFISMQPAVADELCPYSEIESAFMEYVTTIDQPQVETIQQQLNDGGYGPVEVDGVLGVNTRLALQKVCHSFAVTTTEDLAATVVGKLALDNAIIQTYPQWRELVASEPFKGWVGGKQVEMQTQIAQLLATGPAESIVALLDEFTAAMAAPPALQPSPPVEGEQKCVKNVATLPAVDGELIYYAWQGQKKPEEGECTPTEKLPPEVLKPLERIAGVAYPNRMLFMKALAHLFKGSEVDYQTYQEQLLIQARHEPPLPPEPIHLEGDGCGCSRDFDTVVYGFYPYWMARKDLVQQVDFSLFDRIGFYALTLDRNGNIDHMLQWGNEQGSADFIKKAKRYRVAVDLTLHASNWREWNDGNIDNAVNNTMKALFQAKGVTLYIDDYTASAAGRENIVKFVTKLSKKIRAKDKELKLNLMLDLDVEAMADQPLFKALETILLGDEVDHILIPLPESTSNAKKSIRRKVEDEFHGAERKTVLRKIIPVIPPTGHAKDPRGPFSQFTDDLIYFQDNFAGAGFWPLPLPGDEGFDTIKEKLVTLYTSASTSNHLGDAVNKLAPQLCQFACPNRWLFRIGFDLLLGALLIYAMLSAWFSGPRELFKKYLPYFIVAIFATAVIAMVSLICDPFWQKRADIVLVGIIVAGIAYGVWRYVSRVKQFPLP